MCIRDRRGLAHTLLTVEDQNGVKLDARTVDPGDGGNQSLPGDRTDIRCIFGTQIVDQQGVQSGYTVPLESGQIVLCLLYTSLGRFSAVRLLLYMVALMLSVYLFGILIDMGFTVLVFCIGARCV